ncbi:MAG: TonB family protein [Gemmobacter sp.]|jgi:protein TonB|nr:TonB family protein [Gemmobacter sp.]
MTDWAEHLAHRAILPEPARWTLSAVSVLGIALIGAALVSWLDLRPGLDGGLHDAMLIDISALPATEALADLPPASAPPAAPPPPEALTSPERIKDLGPPPRDIAPPDLPEPEVLSQPEQDIAPPEQDMPPSPVPMPEQKPAKKPERTQAVGRPQRETVKKGQPPAAIDQGQTGRAAEPGRSGTVSADAIARWQSKVSTQVARHMKRHVFSARNVPLVLDFAISGDGRVTGVSLAGASGDATLDASVLAHARRLGAVAPPPNGKALSLNQPILITR